ncbi:MAG TPA: hypothetical protein VFS30_09610 [Dehalococcoidia bacterium]|nr:hypothetical protein [Dehalococcoidia bacterium]
MLKRSAVLGLFVMLGVLTLTPAAGLRSPQQARAQEPGPEGGVEATVRALVDAYNRGDLTALFSLTTDTGFEGLLDVTKADALAAPGELFGDQVAVRSIHDVAVTGATATATADFEFGLGIEADALSFVFEGGRWLLDGVQPGNATVPAGTTVVDMKLQEFAFVYDEAAVSSGNVAFNVVNGGAQEHELVILKIDEALSASDLLDVLSEEGDTEGSPPFEDFGFLGIFEPGEGGTAALAHPLDAGKYVFICFLPDVDDVPHAFKGMISEFTVGGTAGPITPPSTGDAGLVGDHSRKLGLIGLSTVLLLLGAASALRPSRS